MAFCTLYRKLICGGNNTISSRRVLSVFAQSFNGAGGQSERHNSQPHCSARKEESLLQVKCILNLLSSGSLLDIESAVF